MLVLGTIAAHTGSPRRPPRHHWLAPACQAQGIRTQRTGISAKGILGSRQAKGTYQTGKDEGFWVRAHQNAERETLNFSLALSPLAQRRNKNSCLPVLSRLTLSQWSVAVGCAAPLHVPCPWAWLLSSSLSLSAHTHSFSARGCARGFPPQRAGQTCKHSPNPRAQGSLPGPAGVSRYRPASSCTYLTSFFSNSGQASNRSATRP